MSTTTEPARKPKQDTVENYWARRELGKVTDRVGRLRIENEKLRAELAETQTAVLALRKHNDWLLNTLRQFTARRVEDNAGEG